MVSEIFINVFLDGITDLIAEKRKRLLTVFGQNQMSSVPNGFGSDETGIDKFTDCLLKGKKIGIFPLKNEIADLCLGKWKIHPIKHI